MFYCNRVVARAPGKINLSLDITGTAPDGYHYLNTVMQAIDLFDVVVVGKRPGEDMRVTCSRPDAPEDGLNIAHAAAREFFAATGIAPQGLSIHIDKLIPQEAGLAGGSADAAAVLCGLDRLFETTLAPAQLAEIGERVGSDVPFCLAGGLRLGQGTGGSLTRLTDLPDCFFTVAKPPAGMSTRYAFKLYDDYSGEFERPDIAAMLRCIESADLLGVGRNMFSVFSQIAMSDESEMLSGIMQCAGAIGSVLSGSGSAVVGLFDSERRAKDCLRLLREQVEEVWIARPVNHGAQVIHVG